MEVIVQDANNIVIEVDQGRQGRGISTVGLVTVGADYYLLFTFTDGSTEQVGPIAPIVTEVLFAEARNAEATTILKGQPVYLFQAQGNLATVKLAFNTSDATSAKTLGLAAENIAPGAQGLITCQGTLGGLNTSAYSEGDTLYLGATAGTLTNVKPQAPNHLVYIGVVERANAGAGQIYVRVQNGYELDEIHDVLINSPVNGNTLIYDAATDLWKNAGITAGSGISVTNGPASITVGNTGVLSFSGGTTGLTPATATAGAVTLAGTLATTNGGTGLSSFTANRVLYTSSTSAIGQSANLTFDGTSLTVGGKATLVADSPFLTGANLTSGANALAIGGQTGNSVVGFFVNNAEQMRLTTTGLGIGTSSPTNKLSVVGNANITGQVTLGDSSTDIVLVNGYMGVGAANDANLLRLAGSGAFGGATQVGLSSLPTGTSIGTTALVGVASSPTTATAAYTVTNTYAFYADNVIKGAGSTITNQHGVFIADQTQGTNNFGISSLVASGANKWNIYASGTAANYFAGNVGIGTSSTSIQISNITTVSAKTAVSVSSTGTTVSSEPPTLLLQNTAAATVGQMSRIAFGAVSGLGVPIIGADITAVYTGAGVANGRSTALVFSTNEQTTTQAPVERMRLDASGNLGLGVTPSAWTGSGGKNIEVGATGNALFGSVSLTTYTFNANFDSSWKYSRTGFASRYEQQDSQHRWYTAPSGTAGNALTFTQAMTLNTSSQLLVGTTTNTNSSTVTAGGTISETVSGTQYLVASQFDVGTAPNKIPLNQYLGNLAYQNASAIAGRVGLSAGTAALPSIGSATDAATGEWFPATSVMAWSTGGVERMRLDAAGVLGLGVTPSAWTSTFRANQVSLAALAYDTANGVMELSNNAFASAAGVRSYITSNGATRYLQTIAGGHQWSTAASGTAGNTISFTQAMTLDASGNLALGTTTPFTRFDSASARTTALSSIASFNTMPVSVTDTTAFAQGVGGGINFRAQLSASNYSTYASIWSFRESATTVDYRGSLLFGTAENGLGYPLERMRITSTGNQVLYQPAESAQNTSVTLTVANLQSRIITSNAAVTLTLPIGGNLDTYVGGMAVDSAFECTFIATTANAITIAANGNTTVGNLTVAGNTSGTFRFRKTAANTFTVYRVA